VHPRIASPTTEIPEMLLDQDHMSHIPPELRSIMSPSPVQCVSHKRSTPQLVCSQVPPPPMTSDPSPVPSSPGCIIALVPPYINPSLPESPLSHNGGPPVSEFPSDRHNPNSLSQFTEEQEILSPPFIQRDGTNPGLFKSPFFENCFLPSSPRVLKVPAYRSTLNRHQYILIKRVYSFLLLAARGGKKAVQISKKRKFVADGIFKAELNEFLIWELAEDGYSGVEVRVTPTRTEIIILATRTHNVLGEKGRRIRELTVVVQKRFGFPEGSVELYAETVATRSLCAIAQAEPLRYKFLGGLAVWRACCGVLRFIMESGAKGCEIVVSGKLPGQRAKSMKFVDGLVIHSGDPVNYYVDTAVRRGVCWAQGKDHAALGPNW
ncbi:hypothetical protein DBR06_SOUSAS20210038, partial [Sousa chinensis]